MLTANVCDTPFFVFSSTIPSKSAMSATNGLHLPNCSEEISSSFFDPFSNSEPIVLNIIGMYSSWDGVSVVKS